MIACVALSFWKHNSILDTISISSLTRGLYQVTALRRQGMLKLTIYKKKQHYFNQTMRVKQENIKYIYTLYFYWELLLNSFNMRFFLLGCPSAAAPLPPPPRCTSASPCWGRSWPGPSGSPAPPPSSWRSCSTPARTLRCLRWRRLSVTRRGAVSFS